MLFNNSNPFAGKSRPEDKLACYWYNTLWNKVMSLFKWSGPDFDGPNATMNSDFLEWTLMTQGQASILIDNDGKMRGIQCSRLGIDPYGFPTTLTGINPVLKGSLNRVVNESCVWVRNNKFAVPVISTISYYASQLAKIQTSLNVSLSNNRMTKVFVAENDPQAQAIRKMVDDVDAGKLAVIVKPGLAEQIMTGAGSSVPVYSTSSEYLADKLLQDMRSVLNDFFVSFGVNASGANMIKHERNLVSEVNSNNQEIMVNRRYWLDTREEAAEIASRIFHTEIKVEMVEPDNFDEEVQLDVQQPEPRNE